MHPKLQLAISGPLYPHNFFVQSMSSEPFCLNMSSWSLSLTKSIIVRNGPTIDDSHIAPVIQILAWLFLTFSILSVAAQFITKFVISREFGASDALLFAALIMYVAQHSVLLSPAGQVIGNSPIGLSDETVNLALKALYSIEILSVLTLFVVKNSVLVALRAITPVLGHRIMIYAASAITVAWGITSAFAVAFQCPSPQRWNVVGQTCIDIPAVKMYTAVMNILTDLSLLVVPTVIILPVHMSWGKRVTILSAFWLRMIVVTASIVHIIYIRRLVIDNQFLHNVWQTVVCQIVVQSTSIVTACIPFLKPFLVSLESGFLRADDINRRTAAGMYGSDRNPKSSGGASSYIKMKNQNWNSREFSVKNQ